MWKGRVKVIDKKPYFGFKCPKCSNTFDYYMSGESSNAKTMIEFIESNIKDKKKEGTTIVYCCPKCDKSGFVDFSLESK